MKRVYQSKTNSHKSTSNCCVICKKNILKYFKLFLVNDHNKYYLNFPTDFADHLQFSKTLDIWILNDSNSILNLTWTTMDNINIIILNQWNLDLNSTMEEYGTADDTTSGDLALDFNSGLKRRGLAIAMTIWLLLNTKVWIL